MPVWLDAHSRRRPTRPCARCGREVPGGRVRLEHLRHRGWALFTPTAYVEWCGHGQEVIPWPERDGWCWLVPVVGEAG